MTSIRIKNTWDEYPIESLVLLNQLRMYNHGFVEAGAYTNVTFDNPQTSGFGTLQRSVDDSIAGSVYEGLGRNWAWEVGAMPPSGLDNVFVPSGIYLDDIFTTPDEGDFYFDFDCGRVVFASGLDPDSVVKCEYSFRNVFFGLTTDRSWKSFQSDYLDKFEEMSEVAPSGLAMILKERRIWLPSVFVDFTERKHVRGLQLGGGEIAEMGLVFHIFADSPKDRDWIGSVINDQAQRSIKLYDINESPYETDFFGRLRDDRVEYPDLLSNFYLQNMFINHSRFNKYEKAGLYYGRVVQGIEIERHGY
jgi:hypothetical protein